MNSKSSKANFYTFFTDRSDFESLPPWFVKTDEDATIDASY